jgi:hypothetical protein
VSLSAAPSSSAIEPRALRRERRRRLAAAQHDEIDAGRQRFDHSAQHLLQGRVVGDILVVVEHEHARRLQVPVDPLEVAAAERARIRCVVRREVRKRGLAPPGDRRFDREPEVMEERGRIFVVGMHPVPHGAQLALGDVSADEGRLTGAGRPGDPHRRTLPRLIQRFKQPRALQRAHRTRPGEFPQERRLPLVRSPLRHRSHQRLRTKSENVPPGPAVN